MQAPRCGAAFRARVQQARICTHAAALGAAVAAALGAPVAGAAPLTLSIAAPELDYDAVERLDSGAVANRETGRLTGLKLSLAMAAPPAGDAGQTRGDACDEGACTPDWQLHATAERLTGVVAYQGHTQGGLPLRARSTIGRDDIALGATRAVPAAGPVQGQLVLRLGQRRVDRAIAPTMRSSALGEVLRWRYVQLGADLRWPLAWGWAARAAAHLEQGLWSRLDVDFHGWADDMRLRPARGQLGHGTALGLVYDAAGGWGLRLQWRRERHPFGASAWHTAWHAGQPVARMHYPGSVQVAEGVEIQVSHTWD